MSNGALIFVSLCTYGMCFAVIATDLPTSRCPDPGQVANAIRKEIRHNPKDEPGFGPGDKLTFRCRLGYRFLTKNVYRVSMICQPSYPGWDKPMPVCEVVTCASPRVPMNGFVDDKNKTLFEYGETLRYSCRDGYELRGQTMNVCQHSGWSGLDMACLLSRCVDPGRPKHGFRSGRSFLLGDTVEFGCMFGYTLLGSAERTCIESRTWNGTIAICDAGNMYCSDPGIPIGGRRIGDKFDLNSTVQFTCRPGFYRNGPSERVCLINREWSGRETLCKISRSYDDPVESTTRFMSKLNALVENAVLCDKLEETNGNNYTDAINCTEGTNYDDVVNYTGSCCYSSPGLDLFLLFDVSGSIPEDEFKMAVEFAENLVDMLNVSKKNGGTRVGVTSFGGTVKVHSRIFRDESSDPDKVKKALRGMKLLGGPTATSFALDNILTVQIPTALKRSSRESNYALILITDGNANTGGDPVRQMNQLKMAYSVDIFVIEVGSHYSRVKLAMLASHEDQVWHLRNSKVFKQITMGIIGEETDECGMRDERGMPNNTEAIQNGWLVQTPETWPWMVGIYKSNNGQFNYTCGGTLIGKRWVLTAAHCFTKRKTNDTLEKLHVIRYAQADLDADDFQQENILEILTHPNYTFTRDEYDNDVALLWLGNAINFSPRARAVCLPDEFEGDVGRNWYTPGWREDYVLGWGTREKRNPGEEAANERFLKAVGVKVTANQTCLDSFAGERAKYKSAFKNTLMFCAGDGSGRDSCRGDGGGPFLSVVKNNATNVKRVYQIGIVSWGTPGCRLVGQYGCYTRLTRYLPWIRNTILEQERKSN